MNTKRNTSMQADILLLIDKVDRLQAEVASLKREMRKSNEPKQIVAFKTWRYGDRIFRVPAETFRRTSAHKWVRYETEEGYDE